MPFKSQQQRKWAHANKDKPGVKKMIDHDPGGKLVRRVSPKKARARRA